MELVQNTDCTATGKAVSVLDLRGCRGFQLPQGKETLTDLMVGLGVGLQIKEYR